MATATDISGIDWDEAFQNSIYVSDADAIRTRWVASAVSFREKLKDRAHLDLAYGPGDREVYDIFRPSGPSLGLAVFIHGGYWHLYDKSAWSHCAAGLCDAGWSVAVPSYPLAPSARISEITSAIGRAVTRAAEEVPGPIRLTGHSAGGHLVARMLCRGVLDDNVLQRIVRAVPISGVYSLAPLMLTEMNRTLGLTVQEAKSESPALADPVLTTPVTFWVGDDERPEFLRQTRHIEELWSAKGAEVRAVFEPGRNHFDVIDSLGKADGTLVKELLR